MSFLWGETISGLSVPEDQFSKRRNWGPTPRYPLVEAYLPPLRGFISVAGPCSVESVEQIEEIARVLGRIGVKYLRGGLFRAGTYPGPNFGWVDEALMKGFKRAANLNGMQTIIEVLDYSPESMDLVSPYADCFQVGARQMQNYKLLRVLGSKGRTVFLKRHPGSTLDEWLGAAEHLLVSGTCDPILIERGGSTHANHVRWDLSISMIPAVKALCDVPIIVDASHGTGRRDLVQPMTLAGIAAGADGFLCEVHPDPKNSLSDADQAFPLEAYPNLYALATDIRTTILDYV